MSLLNSDVVPALPTGGYTIDQSLRFNDDDSAYLSRTPASAGNRKTWTWSGWVKRGNIKSGWTSFFVSVSGSQYTNFGIQGSGSDTLRLVQDNGSGGVYTLNTDAKLRDVSAWYHIVLKVDTTQSTSTDRVKIYLNGVEQSLTGSYPSQNSDTWINYTQSHLLGGWGTVSEYLDGYLAEVNFIDGQALDPTNFGKTGDYGEWKPIEYTGTYGTNGFYLDFDGTYYNDKSGNGNNFTANNLSATDVVLDSPTNNFATLNPLWNDRDGNYSEGNLKWEGGSTHSPSASSIPMESGKYYAEFRAISGSKLSFGVFSNLIKYRKVSGTNYIPGEHTNQDYTGDACVWYYNRIEHNASFQSNPFSSHILVSPNVYMIAFDSDSGKVWFGKEGVWYNNNNQSSTLDVNNPDVTMSVKQSDSFSFHATGENSDWKVNFGQDSSFSGSETAQGNTDSNEIGDFYYTPPSGFLALCTANLPDPDVIPSENFNTVLYTGNGSTQSITGVGFQPDFVWLKNRGGANSHQAFDSIRGATKLLFPNETTAEGTYSTTLQSFDSDGFTVGSSGGTNGSGNPFVAWNWKANGSGVSNTDGTITSTVSANQDAGFSIVSYTGTGSNATVGHGLSSAPDMIIVKRRDSGDGWKVYNSPRGATKYLQLHTTDAEGTLSSQWNDTEPTSSVFSVGTAGDINGSGRTYIAYAFHSVDGFSKVGSYTGNGSTDGSFVYTGFRPAFMMVKDTDAANYWMILDNTRDTYNVADGQLYPNASNSEGSTDTLDFVSNGFKLRYTGGNANYSGHTYIYIAFAETPFKYSNSR